MRYGAIKPIDIANGPGVRVSLFVSGCRNHCPGCFNPETWNFNYGAEFTDETMVYILDLLRNPNIFGLSILGGDPFEPENRSVVEYIWKRVRTEFGESKTIWVWSGYLFEDIQDLPVMEYIDVLVDGPFVEHLKDLSRPYGGSSNQRVIDVRRSKISGTCAALSQTSELQEEMRGI